IAARIAAVDSLSSCGPHAKAQSPPPIAHAPTPIAVMRMSLLPSCLVVMSLPSIADRAGSRSCLWGRMPSRAPIANRRQANPTHDGLVRLRLPQAERRARRIDDHAEPARAHPFGRFLHHSRAERFRFIGGGVDVLDLHVSQPRRRRA